MKVTPEDVGLSGARLYKIDHLTQRYIDAGKIPGSVTLVARRGEIAHLETQGLMDIEADKKMQEDTIFRILSIAHPTAVKVGLLLRGSCSCFSAFPCVFPDDKVIMEDESTISLTPVSMDTDRKKSGLQDPLFGVGCCDC